MSKIIHFPPLKITEEDFEVEFELASEILDDSREYISFRKSEIETELSEINNFLKINDEKLETLSSNIDYLTNHADKIDYIIAVASGVIAGIIDSFWVGEFNLNRGREWSNKKVNNIVVKIAQSQGYQGDKLDGAIRHLEKKFPLSSDSNTPDFGGGLQHHLRDFAHHPTIIGLLFSMLTQFTEKTYGTVTDGSFKIFEVNDKTFIGKNLPQKFLFGTVFWFFHLVSDMAGSSSNPGRGTGLPGPITSFAKELSSLPFFKNLKLGDNSFSVWVSKLFNGTLFAKRDSSGKLIKESVQGFDFRSEIGVISELGRQTLPVVLNECIVRGFYFIRRITFEIKNNDIKQISDLRNIDWKSTLPFRNRTIVRMLTISTSTFTAIDLVDAAIRSGVKNGPPNINPLFLKDFILRVNFIGLGRFAIAVTTDISMAVKREKRTNERIIIMSQQLHLLNAKVFYLQANMWKAAESTAKTIEEAQIKMESMATFAVKAWLANRNSMDKMDKYIEIIKDNDEDLFSEIKEILESE